MNQTRHTAKFAAHVDQRFVLNVPVVGQEALVSRVRRECFWPFFSIFIFLFIHVSVFWCWQVGGCTGADFDKFAHLEIPACRPGWRPLLLQPSSESDSTTAAAADGEADYPREKPKPRQKKGKPVDDFSDTIAWAAAVAHIVCRVHAVADLHGHFLLTGSLEAAFVRSSYWDGRCFLPRTPQTPPYV